MGCRHHHRGHAVRHAHARSETKECGGVLRGHEGAESAHEEVVCRSVEQQRDCGWRKRAGWDHRPGTGNADYSSWVSDTTALDDLVIATILLLTHIRSTSQELSPISNATMMFNAVDSPVGVIPVTRVDPAKDALIDGTWPASRTSNGGGGSKLVGRACAKAYDVQAMEGVPVGVQVRYLCVYAHALVLCFRSIFSQAHDQSIHTDCRSKVGGREGPRYDGHR
jgi:hypothetical protein